MSPRHAPVLLALVFALSAGVSAQPPAGTQATVIKLRNTAAADVAQALTTFAGQKNLDVIVVAEPTSNTVLVKGDTTLVKQVIELIARIDREPSMVRVKATILDGPAGFAEETGLGTAAEAKWALTPREARMLTAAIGKAKDQTVVSKPEMVVMDNQTGFFQIADGPAAFTARVTPRVAPDGKSVLLRVETQISKPADGRGTDTTSVQTTESIPTGGTLVIRGPRTKSADGSREILVVLTVDRVVSSDR